MTYPTWGAIQQALQWPVFEYNGARKIVRNLLWQPDHLPFTDLAEIGYKSPSSKMKALNRMYFSEGEASRVRALLTKRKDQAFTAVCMSMRGGQKDSRSMGHCIESISFSITPKRVEATVMYRSTELIRKFCADLAFLPTVFERLEVAPSRVDFFFSNAYLSGVFFPTLFKFHPWKPFLEGLRTGEPELFKVATRFLRRSVRSRHAEFPYSPEHHQHLFAWENYPKEMPKINSYLERHL